ncbi:MAG: hypothetical protein B5M55_07110 [Desulfococcus sp. 4484_242]|nr:MAG: hypothetical protein B5M55_07110 [Desulfococcus sp. 4484_242]
MQKTQSGGVVETGHGGKGGLLVSSVSGKGSGRFRREGEVGGVLKAPEGEGVGLGRALDGEVLATGAGGKKGGERVGRSVGGEKAVGGGLKAGSLCGEVQKTQSGGVVETGHGGKDKSGKRTDGSEIKATHEARGLRFVDAPMERGMMKDSLGGSARREMGVNAQTKMTSDLHANRGGKAKAVSHRIRLENQDREVLIGKPKEERELAVPASKKGIMLGDSIPDRVVRKPESGLPDSGQPSVSHGSRSSKTPFQVPVPPGPEPTGRSFQEKGIRQIVEKAFLNWRNGKQEFNIELKPESLGRLQVMISTEDHQVKVKIVARTQSAKDLIEGNVAQLKAGFQSHGLKVDLFDVSVGQDSRHQGTAFDPGPFHERTGSGHHPAWQGRGDGLEDEGPEPWGGSETLQGWDERAVNFFA